jgi:hypothetical protein
MGHCVEFFEHFTGNLQLIETIRPMSLKVTVVVTGSESWSQYRGTWPPREPLTQANFFWGLMTARSPYTALSHETNNQRKQPFHLQALRSHHRNDEGFSGSKRSVLKHSNQLSTKRDDSVSINRTNTDVGLFQCENMTSPDIISFPFDSERNLASST